MKLGTYVLIRDDKAGVLIGTLSELDGTAWSLLGARKIWSWSGAAAVEGIAAKGLGAGSKVTPEVEMQTGLHLVQCIKVAPECVEALRSFPEWEV